MNYKTNQVLLPLSIVYRTPKNAHSCYPFYSPDHFGCKMGYLLILYNESKHNILAYQGKANKLEKEPPSLALFGQIFKNLVYNIHKIIILP
jgi:hypothetical protein